MSEEIAMTAEPAEEPERRRHMVRVERDMFEIAEALIIDPLPMSIRMLVQWPDPLPRGANKMIDSLLALGVLGLLKSLESERAITDDVLSTVRPAAAFLISNLGIRALKTTSGFPSLKPPFEAADPDLETECQSRQIVMRRLSEEEACAVICDRLIGMIKRASERRKSSWGTWFEKTEHAGTRLSVR